MIKNFFLFAIASLFTLSITSCKKPIPGCTDSNAENFDGLAEEDNGSCSYRGSAVFYHTQQTSQNLLAAEVTNVKLYVDGNFWDAMSPNIYFDFIPTCNHEDAMKVANYGTGSDVFQTLNYRITDQDENILDEGTFILSGNECNAIEYYY